MDKLKSVFFASLLIVLASVAAHAQANRTWVSGVGDDQNPCSRTSPCRTYAGAISRTIAGGEINALDSGGFGAVIISKSITIDGTGTLASSLAAAGSGITINMTQVKDPSKSSVRLRGLSVNGLGTGVNGINIVEAGAVSIEDCVIDGFNSNGIYVGSGTVFVRNTTIRNNGKAGIIISAGRVALADVAIVFNGRGFAGSIAPVSLAHVHLFGNRAGDPA